MSKRKTNMESAATDDEFGEWIDAQSTERLTLITNRALRTYDLDEMPSEDEITDELSDAIHQELALVYVEDIFRSLEDKGLVHVSGVDTDGELEWGLTSDGAKVVGMPLTDHQSIGYTHFNAVGSDERNHDATDLDLPAPGRKPQVGTRILTWAKAKVLS
jgi:hypothetical protein